MIHKYWVQFVSFCSIFTRSNHNNIFAGLDDKESISSGTGLYNGPPLFQNLLLRFLDNDAPILGNNNIQTMFIQIF